MAKPVAATVQQVLDGAGARRLNHCDLNLDLSLALWSNRDVHVHYHRVAHHTLSLYLRGGYGTRRLDGRNSGRGFGAPDKLCLMPATQDSEWEVGQYQEFVHLYISDAGLRHFALESFDCDPRRVQLPDLTFFENPQINAACRVLLHTPWVAGGERLLLQQGAYELMGQLIRSYVKPNGLTGPLKGGLSRRQYNAVRDHIQAHFGEALNLDALAQTAGLSRFHFARMFKISTGLTPHQYVNKVRVERGRELLEQGSAQVEVAGLCGFAHQSHFAAHFKRHFGVTPGQYLRSL
ncbi:AraC family transcriptional regulator [Microbulbifer taiwanensis]|uniref:Helix-turn-helix domain-containing protein n=1 Tax=Microbulbifer taiwanensis TaxID=986746 RepID=A0ABW1YK76_9GAMM|nr:AraC family transcriptional regulator [Microbulbifer taiwanensis]